MRYIKIEKSVDGQPCNALNKTNKTLIQFPFISNVMFSVESADGASKDGPGGDANVVSAVDLESDIVFIDKEGDEVCIVQFICCAF